MRHIYTTREKISTSIMGSLTRYEISNPDMTNSKTSLEIQALVAMIMKSMSENIEVWNMTSVTMEYRVAGNIGMARSSNSVD